VRSGMHKDGNKLFAALRTRTVAVAAFVSRHRTAAEVASVAAVAALATVVRVWRLTTVGFGGDEAVYAGQAALLAHFPGMDRWFIPASRGNSNFLVTQWLVSLLYRAFGLSDYLPRLLSVVASVATVVLVYLIARQLYGRRREALLAALVMAVSGYAVLLGRLALLDATACFLLAASMYCLTRWVSSDRLVWLGLFVVVTAVAVQAKVTNGLILPITVLVMLLTRSWRRLTWRRILAVAPLGLLALTPAIVQVFANSGGVRDYFSASTARTSAVPWYYYLGIVRSNEGALLSAVLLLGVLVAMVSHQRADALPLIWLGTYAVFVQLYPLKGFNYVLPLMPPLALLAGRGLGWVVAQLHRGLRWSPAVLAASVAVVLVGSQAGVVRATIHNDRSAGMREAARWLEAHGAGRAGVMTLSHGSGQYVLPFYGGIDSYPYGRFRIATVVPGGQVVKTTPRIGGLVPLDWVTYWPARLIDEGRVSYLVYQTRPLEDPPEQSEVAVTVTEKQFRSMIGQYGGRLVHTVYWQHEARVYIYRVTKHLAEPVITARPIRVLGTDGSSPSSGTSSAPATREAFLVKAHGFAFGSPLTVTYHGQRVGSTVADPAGSATLRVDVPITGRSQYHLIVSDQKGNSASVTGVSRTKLSYRVDHGIVRVSGVGFKPRGRVVLSYRQKTIDVTRAHANGSVSWSFRLPANTHPRFRILATGEGGRVAYAIGLSTPSLAFVTKDHVSRLTGLHYSASSRVSLTLRNHVVGVAHTDATGAFRQTLVLPSWTTPGDSLTATDPIGRQATVRGVVGR
jgi:dolichyl-phosphate-mannose-protein mannosyltransferase